MVEQNLSEDDGGNFAICFSLKKLNYSEQKWILNNIVETPEMILKFKFIKI